MLVAGGRLQLLSAILAFIAASAPVNARQHHYHSSRAQGLYTHSSLSMGAPIIQCVAFAKQDAGINISGNARDWWGNAAGIYDRGSTPKTGSVLSFREIGRMPLGHVAVVSGVQDSRTILIDQSHWNSRGITRGVIVEDVSDNNDWSAVRVQLKQGGVFGSIYPTHGFIYPRADRPAARLIADYAGNAGLISVRRTRRVHSRTVTELAEASDTGRALDLTIHSQLGTIAP